MRLQNIIVQAGGKGRRLETLTLNKPKCLVPVDNLPILFHSFKRFPTSRFIIIADYKSDVLIKYLKAFATVDFEVVVTKETGTCSGINQALEFLKPADPFILTWCDLVLSPEVHLPTKLDQNYVGISGSFKCRWSHKNTLFVKEPSTEDGVAGFFIFKDKTQLTGLQSSGEFVSWLSTQEIPFERYSIAGSREIGTVLSYYQQKINKPNCRPFNQVIFTNDVVEKSPLDEQGRKLAEQEEDWYKKVISLNYKKIPKIHSFSPLKMQRIQGRNIYEYNTLTPLQKKEILKKIITGLKDLHATTESTPASKDDCVENCITKTFERLAKVQDLVPFAGNEFVTVNGVKCRNVLFYKDELKEQILKLSPPTFHLIHGDPTFSNIILETEKIEPYFIDPRGYFGKSKYYGDKNYDWAKLYYSVVGNYDQFNLKNFSLEISESDAHLKVLSSNWEELKEVFFAETGADPKSIKLLHAIIWLSLTTYTWEDYDSICGAFYNGLLHLEDAVYG